uniref:Uncharacterized protein LOC104240604 isoform X1 n=1 Tax=Nicotiana sylvestris TaxID=4096 RepID=A0A1U7Y3E6_NICSY|nr:PREDICTED: uncharacterized protein LOC104240604 isoform X1 [Nicotiana sylvestris]XP_009793774.1 PREDICTED: uncharacterized protein LOC104240604 isoform X2 [Nicotiana sylvestris]
MDFPASTSVQQVILQPNGGQQCITVNEKENGDLVVPNAGQKRDGECIPAGTRIGVQVVDLTTGNKQQGLAVGDVSTPKKAKLPVDIPATKVFERMKEATTGALNIATDSAVTIFGQNRQGARSKTDPKSVKAVIKDLTQPQNWVDHHATVAVPAAPLRVGISAGDRAKAGIQTLSVQGVVNVHNGTNAIMAEEKPAGSNEQEQAGQSKKFADDWIDVMRSPSRQDTSPAVKAKQQHLSVPAFRQDIITPNSFDALVHEEEIGINSSTLNGTMVQQQIVPCTTSETNVLRNELVAKQAQSSNIPTLLFSSYIWKKSLKTRKMQ